MSKKPNPIPQTQYAVQLVGPSELKLNRAKPVSAPGPRQVLVKIEAVGLCFSDLKLLKQFAGHTRKGKILSGIDPGVLKEIPSYVPGDKPTVPGHEGVCRIVAVGDKVKRYKVGERCLVETDYRTLRTTASNASFGYNFEGALQEYVLMDERIIIDPITGERFLIPVPDDLGASAVALVEPWACVEDSYAMTHRRTIEAGGKLLIAADPGHEVAGLAESFPQDGRPDVAMSLCAEDSQRESIKTLGLEVQEADDVSALVDESFDDIVYFGADAAKAEALNGKLAAKGIFNIVTGGKTFARAVSIDVGRVHYGLTRLTGTTERSAAAGYRHIPPSGEIRPGEKIVVVGAGGPMGQMHVIRDICTGIEGVSVVATDFDEQRLQVLRAKAMPLAEANGVDLRLVDPRAVPLDEKFSYVALMAPVPELVAEAVDRSSDGCVINIFAGIPAGKRALLNLNTYLANHCWMLGTSGSVISDMKIVLEKVSSGQLDTNCSVVAVSGMAGAVDGIAAVENRTLPGKTVVYPELHDLGLIPLTELHKHYPTVAEKLASGMWTPGAEKELLAVAR